MSDSSQLPRRQDYFRLYKQITRWHDNDIYGHVNNVVYYSFFDSAVNRYLIEECGLNIHQDQTVGYVVTSNCQYFAPIAYPDNIEVGFRVNKLGTKSVEYGTAIFVDGAEQAAAVGSFTHVFVNREEDKSEPIPVTIRSGLELALKK